MRILNDPEIESGELLAIYIQVAMDPEVAVGKLHNFWEQWMFDTLADINNKILIDVELV
jgi:hypothetical protein